MQVARVRQTSAPQECVGNECNGEVKVNWPCRTVAVYGQWSEPFDVTFCERYRLDAVPIHIHAMQSSSAGQVPFGGRSANESNR